jgi:hypothetical protein
MSDRDAFASFNLLASLTHRQFSTLRRSSLEFAPLAGCGAGAAGQMAAGSFDALGEVSEFEVGMRDLLPATFDVALEMKRDATSNEMGEVTAAVFQELPFTIAGNDPPFTALVSDLPPTAPLWPPFSSPSGDAEYELSPPQVGLALLPPPQRACKTAPPPLFPQPPQQSRAPMSSPPRSPPRAPKTPPPPPQPPRAIAQGARPPPFQIPPLERPSPLNTLYERLALRQELLKQDRAFERQDPPGNDVAENADKAKRQRRTMQTRLSGQGTRELEKKNLVALEVEAKALEEREEWLTFKAARYFKKRRTRKTM